MFLESKKRSQLCKDFEMQGPDQTYESSQAGHLNDESHSLWGWLVAKFLEQTHLKHMRKSNGMKISPRFRDENKNI